ncbi:hypothetical protein [Isoptericola aurantiacus]|uniref:hypothetical protein n=1 Tax=Isoptericola aurantiacus TaxID=3377839 RepID=UPI00383A3651
MTRDQGHLDLDLPPEQVGKRVERVEWGLRQTVGTVLMDRGEVDMRPSEENARALVGDVYSGHRGTEVVRRVVVTYTTPWEAP